MNDLREMKKGDVVFVQKLGAHRVVSVVSAGRKWLTTSDGDKYDRVTGRGETSYGWTLYRSEADYVQQKELAEAWRLFCRTLDGYLCPTSVTSIEQIERALRILDGGE